WLRALAAAFHRLSFYRLHAEFDLRSNRRATSGALGESAGDDSGFYLTLDCRAFDFTRGRRVVVRRETPCPHRLREALRARRRRVQSTPKLVGTPRRGVRSASRVGWASCPPVLASRRNDLSEVR